MVTRIVCKRRVQFTSKRLHLLKRINYTNPVYIRVQRNEQIGLECFIAGNAVMLPRRIIYEIVVSSMKGVLDGLGIYFHKQ